ncbi:MAG: uroporphyrinogen decarboxylase [Acidimicrobiales bacterium]
MRPAAHLPVWFMRQAGRALPEYRAARGSGSILDAIAQPELVAQLTLQPVQRYGVDAAVLFSDIVVPVHAIGFGVEVRQGLGPVVERPFTGRGDLSRLRALEPVSDIPYVLEAVSMLAAELKVPLIAFAGAPYTVASYLIEGGPSRTYARTKIMMREDPATFAELLDVLADLAIAFLDAQLGAGASAAQLFDSWAGSLSPGDYQRHVMPSSAKVLQAFEASGAPRIHFGVGTGQLLGLMAAAGADVIGVDWRTPISEARKRIGPGRAVQGNLDPTACLASWPVVEAEVRSVLADAGTGPGHIFNLGHGVLPETDPGILAEIVALVHEAGAQP